MTNNEQEGVLLARFKDRNKIGKYVDRISGEPESKWDDLLEMLPDELAFPGLSNQTLKEKVGYELSLKSDRLK